MTVATTYSNELTVSKLVLRAYQLAGLAPPEQNTSSINWAPRQALASDLLQSILDAIQAEGVQARSVKFVNTTLIEGQYIYSLPDNVLDVVGNGAYIDPTQPSPATVETPVEQKDREFWQRLSAKSAASRPASFFTDREATPTQVRIWPIPSSTEAGGFIRFQVQQLFADITNTNSTVDLQRYWSQYLMWELAHQLAISANKLTHGQYLASQAQQKLERALAAGNQNVASSFLLDHSTGWS